jgi:hypothetical protein
MKAQKSSVFGTESVPESSLMTYPMEWISGYVKAFGGTTELSVGAAYSFLMGVASISAEVSFAVATSWRDFR